MVEKKDDCNGKYGYISSGDVVMESVELKS